MIFKELIEDLKKVKSEKNISQELASDLFNGAIQAQLTVFANEGKLNSQEAFDMTRMLVLKALDLVLLEILEDEHPDDEGLPLGFDLGSPTNDQQFNADIEKAIEAYNDRISK